MGDVIEQAAAVLGRCRHARNKPMSSLDMARALAEAGLLRSDADPLGDLTALLDAPFHSWVEFVEQVARPMVEADGDPDPEIMRLYGLTNPYYLCTSLVMAYERSKRAEARSDAEAAVIAAAEEETEAEEHLSRVQTAWWMHSRTAADEYLMGRRAKRQGAVAALCAARKETGDG